jgi:putative isomerase
MMDHSPIHDEAVLVADSHTLDCEDVALNSLVALDGEILALMARELGHDGDADVLEQQAADLRARIRERLWDPERRIFANRLWSGHFVRSIAPTSFFPLICGAASPEQARDLVERHLTNPAVFGGDHMMPSVSRDDPAFGDNVYWRGRIWPPLNFITYYGLRRYGFDEAATLLAEASYGTFMTNWREDRICGENFNADTGRADDQPDTDLFYTWGALMTYPGIAEISDVNPWQGWTLTHPGTESLALGPFRSPAGEARIEADGEWLTLLIDGAPRLRTNVSGRWTHLTLAMESLAAEVPAGDGARAVVLPGVTITGVSLDGQPLAADSGGTIVLPPTAAPARLEIAFNP